MKKLLLLALLLPRLAWAAIAPVTGAIGTSSTLTCAVSPTLTNGDTAVVTFGNYNVASQVVTGVADNGTTTYTQRRTEATDLLCISNTSACSRTEAWTGVISGSPTTITMTVSTVSDAGMHLPYRCSVETYSGVAAVGGTCVNWANDVGTPATCSITTQDANNWIVGATQDGPGTSGGWTAGSGATMRRSDSNVGIGDTGPVVSPGSTAINLNMSGGPDFWTLVGVELRSTASSAAVPTRTLMGVGQ